MGLIWGIMVVFITVTLVLGVAQFRSFVTSSTESVSNDVNALAAAEAGMNWALAELQGNANFQTHDLARVTNAEAVLKTPGTVPQIRYESPRRMASVLDGLSGKLPGGFEVEATSAGPWRGVVGKGLGGIGRGFAGQFQVVVAPVFLPGEATPRKVIESVGRFGKRQTGVRTFVELNAPIVTPPVPPKEPGGPTPWPPPGGPPPNGGPPTTIDLPTPPKPTPPPPAPTKQVPVPTLFPPPIEQTPVGPPPTGFPPLFPPTPPKPVPGLTPPPGGWILTFASSLANWLIADGEFVDVGMGSPSDPRNTNVFKYGGFYGQFGVQLGHIEPGTNGTNQQFRQFGYFQSPGTVWFKDAFPRTTFFDPNQAAQVSGEADLGPYPSRPVAPDPQLYFQTAGMVRYDKLPLPDLVQSMEATIADPRVRNKINIDTGSLANGTPDDQPAYAGRPFLQQSLPFDNPYGNPGPTIHLDFGKPKYLAGVAPGEGDDPINYRAAGLLDEDPDPSKVTAFLYCKGKNVVVWGCPDRDVIIYTDRDIYVAGDFNQSPWHHQTYTSQVDASYAERDGRDTRYIDPVRFAIDAEAIQQGEPSNLEYLESCREGSSSWTPVRRDHPGLRGRWCHGTEERKLAFLVAGSRVWFDYRHPSRFLANELVPWIEYRLLRAMGAPDAVAARAISYQNMAEFSQVARARTLNLNAPPPPLAPDQIAPFVANVLKLPPGPAADRARALLAAPLGDPARAIPELAERLFHVLQVEDVAGRTTGANGAGIYGMAQEYYDTAFDASSASPTLNRLRLPGADPALTRLYVPEQTINAIIMDGARRHGVWKMDPSSDAKIHDELGNSNGRGNRYLRYADNPKASPAIGRVFGSVWHLRQSEPNPPLFEKGGVYLPHKRKRVYDRGQARFLDASLRMGTGGLGGMKNTFTLRAWSPLDGAPGDAGPTWIVPNGW